MSIWKGSLAQRCSMACGTDPQDTAMSDYSPASRTEATWSVPIADWSLGWTSRPNRSAIGADSAQ